MAPLKQPILLMFYQAVPGAVAPAPKNHPEGRVFSLFPKFQFLSQLGIKMLRKRISYFADYSDFQITCAIYLLLIIARDSEDVNLIKNL